VSIEIPSITVAGVTIAHNTQKWRVATNRHPTTYGRSWGWIDGAPGNVCWSNDERFDEKAAGEAVKLHNDWLEEQKPPLMKLIEAAERQKKIAKRFDDAKAAFEKAQAELEAVDREVIRLSLQAAPGMAA
jgi:hypothetical protein